jgi:hypothetical protein
MLIRVCLWGRSCGGVFQRWLLPDPCVVTIRVKGYHGKETSPMRRDRSLEEVAVVGELVQAVGGGIGEGAIVRKDRLGA